MKLPNYLLLFLFLSLVFGSCTQSVQTSTPHNPEASAQRPAPDNLSGQERPYHTIIKTVDDFDTGLFAALNGTVISSFQLADGYRYFLIKTATAGSSFRTAAEQYEGVLYTQPDYISNLPHTASGHTDIVPPRFRKPRYRSLLNTQEGNLRNDPAALLYDWGLTVTGALEAFQRYDASDAIHPVLAAIIDTGTNSLHEDFFDNSQQPVILCGRSSLKRGSPAELPSITTIDPHINWDNAGHGTHCAGIMTAAGNNSRGICGVAHKNTRLITYRGIDAKGSTEFSVFNCLADLTKIVIQLRKAPAQRDWRYVPDVPPELRSYPQLLQATIPVNMSLGGSSSHPFEMEILNQALAAGILPVVAMGNDGKTATAFPAAYQGVIAVGATTMYDTRALFSNGGSWMSVCAPGESIYSCGNGGSSWSHSHSPLLKQSYLWLSGTSMAAPFVTGTATYLLSINPALTPYQIKTALEHTADKINAAAPDYGYNSRGHSKWYGYGRVNVLKAAQMVQENKVPPAGSIYAETAVNITIQRSGSGPISKIPVWIYEKKSGVCAASGITNNAGFIAFRGLRSDTEYEIGVNVSGTYQNLTITPDSTSDTAYTFLF